MKEQSYTEDHEITLKELLLKVNEYFQVIIKRWKLILLITLPFVLFFLFKAYRMPVTYTSELTFMMNDDSGGGLGALGGLAATLGIGGAKGEFNLEKMLSLLKSRNIIQSVLFEKMELEGKNDFFANHIITLYDFHEDWKGNESLEKFLFKNGEVNKFTRKENKVLKSIYKFVIGSSKKKGLLSSNIDEETGIMTLKIESINEPFSIIFLNALYSNLSSFYIDKTIEKQKQTFKIIENKVDSLSNVINSLQSKLLKLKDSHRNTTLNQYRSEELRLEREYQINLLAYGEALKNKEIADFSLKTKTPFIQSIDLPIPPLYPNKSYLTYVTMAITGCILGLFLAIAIVLGRKIYHDVME